MILWHNETQGCLLRTRATEEGEGEWQKSISVPTNIYPQSNRALVTMLEIGSKSAGFYAIDQDFGPEVSFIEIDDKIIILNWKTQ